MFNLFSPQSKVKKLIKENLKFTLNDFDSYKPAELGEIKVVKTKYNDSLDYRRNLEKIDRLIADTGDNQEKKKEINSTIKGYEIFGGAIEIYEKSERIKNLFNQIDINRLNFVPEVVGWKVNYKFKSKNQNGIYENHHYEFYFDKELSKIQKTIDITEGISNL